MLELRPMHLGDLTLVERWLGEPHVARWFLAGSSLEAELSDIRQSLSGDQVHMLLVVRDGQPVGWCQWYPCDVDPAWAADMDAEPDDVGVDYAIGERTHVGSGIGTELIAALVARVRAVRPDSGIVADPEAENLASRRVLEKNGFELMDVKTMPSEPSDAPMAIYRLPPAGSRDRR
jgi:RimJ/RimL family protein N-acetyltransferase